jgi:hypothetical protein
MNDVSVECGIFGFVALAGGSEAIDAPRSTGYNSNVQNLDIIDIQACLNGDDQGYHRLLRRHETGVSRLMWRFSRDRTICEELVQEVFVQAYFSLTRFRGDGPFAAWLHRTPPASAITSGNSKSEPPEWSLQDIGRRRQPGIRTPWILRRPPNSCTACSRAFAADRLVLTLMYFEDCSTEQIAQRMSWTRAWSKCAGLESREKVKALAEQLRLLEKLDGYNEINRKLVQIARQEEPPEMSVSGSVMAHIRTFRYSRPTIDVMPVSWVGECRPSPPRSFCSWPLCVPGDPRSLHELLRPDSGGLVMVELTPHFPGSIVRRQRIMGLGFGPADPGVRIIIGTGGISCIERLSDSTADASFD